MNRNPIIDDVDLHVRAAEMLVSDVLHDQQHFVDEFGLGVDEDAIRPSLDLLPEPAPTGLVEFLTRVTFQSNAPRARFRNTTREYKWLPLYECVPFTTEQLFQHQSGSAPAIYILPGGLFGMMCFYEQGDGDMIAYDTQTGMILNVDVGASFEPDGDYLGINFSRVWGSVFEFVSEQVTRKQAFPPVSWQNDVISGYWEERRTDPSHLGPVDETSVFHAFVPWNPDSVQRLLDAGADLEHRNSLQQTPLLFACSRWENEETVAEFLRLGADVNAIDMWGSTPLMLAARMGDARVVKHLVDAGADKEKTDPWGRTAIELISRFAYERNEVLSLLG